MPMNCLMYFDDPAEAPAAVQYGKRLREEGHRCQFRNGRIFKFEPIPEVGKPPFDTILVSKSVSSIADIYQRWFENPDCQHRGKVEMVSLEPVEVPQTPVDEVVATELSMPPLPTEPVDYLAMPWHTLRKEIGILAGTKPQNKKEATAMLKTLGLL